MTILCFIRKLFYYTIFILIIQSNLYANTDKLNQEYNQTITFQGNFTKSSVMLESLTPYSQAILVIFTSLLGIFFLRDELE